MKKRELYAEMDALVDEADLLPPDELKKAGWRIQRAFEDGKVVMYGLGPVRQKNLVPLTKKEAFEAQSKK